MLEVLISAKIVGCTAKWIISALDDISEYSEKEYPKK